MKSPTFKIHDSIFIVWSILYDNTNYDSHFAGMYQDFQVYSPIKHNELQSKRVLINSVCLHIFVIFSI